MKLGVALALVAAALVVAVESCGGPDEPRLTYPQLQRQAGAICGRYRRGLAKLGAPVSLPKIAVVARGAYRLGAAERKALAKLRPPADGADAFDRLLDAGEAREIVRHYEEEPEFREQVNRYIHDFEAMLRRVTAERDGGMLAVTLMSSDMGKLYAALAPVVDRRR